MFGRHLVHTLVPFFCTITSALCTRVWRGERGEHFVARRVSSENTGLVAYKRGSVVTGNFFCGEHIHTIYKPRKVVCHCDCMVYTACLQRDHVCEYRSRNVQGAYSLHSSACLVGFPSSLSPHRPMHFHRQTPQTGLAAWTCCSVSSLLPARSRSGTRISDRGSCLGA